MSRKVRNILLAAMVFFTLGVVIICTAIAGAVRENIYYDVIYDGNVSITDVKTEKIGKSYHNKKSRDGKTFYSIEIVLYNESNSLVRKYANGFDYVADCNDYVEMVYEDGLLALNSYVIPAGCKGIVRAVVDIPDDAGELSVYFWQKEKERFTIELER